MRDGLCTSEVDYVQHDVVIIDCVYENVTCNQNSKQNNKQTGQMWLAKASVWAYKLNTIRVCCDQMDEVVGVSGLA